MARTGYCHHNREWSTPVKFKLLDVLMSGMKSRQGDGPGAILNFNWRFRTWNPIVYEGPHLRYVPRTKSLTAWKKYSGATGLKQ
jgi:hypothetical protein